MRGPKRHLFAGYSQRQGDGDFLTACGLVRSWFDTTLSLLRVTCVNCIRTRPPWDQKAMMEAIRESDEEVPKGDE